MQDFTTLFGFTPFGHNAARPVELHLVRLRLRQLASIWGQHNDAVTQLRAKYEIGDCQVPVAQALKDQEAVDMHDKARCSARQDFANALKLAKDAGFKLESEDIQTWYQSLTGVKAPNGDPAPVTDR